MDLTAYFASPDRRNDAKAPQPVLVKGALRADLPALLRGRGYAVGAEVGVYRGEYSEALCQGVPGLHLYCVDPWAPFYGADGREIYKSAEPAYDIAKERLAPYHCTFIRERSPEAAARFQDRTLDFVYLDADHRYAHVVADMLAWLPKIKPGGLLCGHDYETDVNKHNQVSVAVQGWMESYRIAPWYVLGRAKVCRGEAWERQRTWLWTVTPALTADLDRRRY